MSMIFKKEEEEQTRPKMNILPVSSIVYCNRNNLPIGWAGIDVYNNFDFAQSILIR